MSQQAEQTSEKSNKKENIITSTFNQDNILNDEKDVNKEQSNELSEELLAEDFDFFEKESNRQDNLKVLENSIAEIKKENTIDLDEYIKDCIQDLEDFSTIFGLEDLIFDPEYTLKSFMKSLKQVINFKYFYTKFTIPKEHKEDKNSINIGTNNKKKNKRSQKCNKIEQKNFDELKNNDKNNQSGEKNFSKKKKNDLILKLFLRDSKTNFSLELKVDSDSSNNNKTFDSLEKSKSDDKHQMNTSSSQTSKEKNSSIKDDKSITSKGETFSKFEEYKLIKYDIILYIINNKANIEEGELVEGKNYESKVRKYFQIVLDICSDKFLSVYKNNGTPIEGLYKYYENLVQRNKIQKNANISGDSKKENEYNKLEFDLMVDHVKKNVINNILDIFKCSIIAKNNIENLEEETEYQIVGEVGKDILNQSIDKNKQIGKIIDILLIEQYLTYAYMTDNNNPFKNQVIKEYDNLKLDINEKKIIFLFTNGSFVELKKALLFNELNDEKKIKDYDSFDIKTIFPIKNKRRYGKNIVYLKLIVKKLNESKIPYIIFYIGEELNNGIERILINHIKNTKDTNIYNSIISKIKTYENLVSENISQSYLIKKINKSLKILNKNEIFNKIKNIIEVPHNKKNEYYDFLYKNLIEIRKIERKNYILIFLVGGVSLSPFYEEMIKMIKDINDKSFWIHIELV